MSNIIFVDDLKQGFNAGSKARTDIANILNELGYKKIELCNSDSNNISKIIDINRAFKKASLIISRNDYIILQYPYGKKTIKYIHDKIKALKKKCKFHFVLIIHDIVYLRGIYGIKNIEQYKDFEIDFFNYADILIVHNNRMKTKLINEGVTTPMVCLDLFDYLSDIEPQCSERHDCIEVAFAGNLDRNKSGFIYRLKELENSRIVFNLYGNGYIERGTNCHYLGSYGADQIVGEIRGDFGLVWDGPSITSCSGLYGEYLRYNNPHKASLYLAAGLPIITWDQSALGDFVEHYNVGVKVDSLENLERVLHHVDYVSLKQNVLNFSTKIRSGFFLKSAITEMDSYFLD